MTNTQISCWYPKQVVTSEQMAVNQYDLYQRIANLIPASTTGTIVELSDITVVGGTISIGAGFFRFPNAVYDFLPEQTVILGGTDSATIPLSDGYLVARSSIFPTIPNQTNYTVGVDYVITSTPDATTDCIIALVSGDSITLIGNYLVNKATTQNEVQAGIANSSAVTPSSLAWALQNIQVANSKYADHATTADNATHATASTTAEAANRLKGYSSADASLIGANWNGSSIDFMVDATPNLPVTRAITADTTSSINGVYNDTGGGSYNFILNTNIGNMVLFKLYAVLSGDLNTISLPFNIYPYFNICFNFIGITATASKCAFLMYSGGTEAYISSTGISANAPLFLYGQGIISNTTNHEGNDKYYVVHDDLKANWCFSTELNDLNYIKSLSQYKDQKFTEVTKEDYDYYWSLINDHTKNGELHLIDNKVTLVPYTEEQIVEKQEKARVVELLQQAKSLLDSNYSEYPIDIYEDLSDEVKAKIKEYRKKLRAIIAGDVVVDELPILEQIS